MTALPRFTLPVQFTTRPVLDPVLFGLIVGLVLAGLVILASASLSAGETAAGRPLFFFERQLVAVVLGVAAAAVMLLIPTELWERLGFLLLVAGLVALTAVLIPGIGLSEKGATRWVSVGGVVVQVSDPARLALLLYTAGYIVRRQQDLSTRFLGLAKPMLVVTVACVLLLAEPDFGAATVLAATILTMLFIGGARLRDFALFIVAALIAVVLLITQVDYRAQRLTGFLNPWADPYDKGFQLTQSLIAIGRGEWFGVGLGDGVQKLSYLPEAHTDFVFAVFAEEFGLIGSIALIVAFFFLVFRLFELARRAADSGCWFQCYVALGIAIWLGLQTFINLGVNMGLLPTKGLTLPLVSYGRSSLIMTLATLGLALRIHHEVSLAESGKTRGRRRARSRR